MKSIHFSLIISTFLLGSLAEAALEVASPFGDHMVLQRDMTIPVWGTADPGAEVRVEFAGKSVQGVAGANGEWKVELGALKASSKPQVFKVMASGEEVAFEDVLVGEVWLCGGQSNMERQLGPRPGQKDIIGWKETAAAADYPLIRELYVQQARSLEQQDRLEGKWTVCTPESVEEFSAVGFFFAQDLHASLEGVPVGVIHSSWGGTPVEAWTSLEGLSAFPEFDEALEMAEMQGRNPVAAAKRYEAALSKWYAESDPGTGDNSWAAVELDEQGWESMDLPVMWEDAGHEGFDGIAWFRKRFDVPSDWKGEALELRLGAIDDVDTTWVNGVLLGSTTGWTTKRLYQIPAEILRDSDNVVAVRVLDTGGGGGIWDTELPIEVEPAHNIGSPHSLAGEWKARFGDELDGSNPPPQDVSNNSGTPTGLFNAMIAPLIPYPIRGIAFYQGEANAGRPKQYRRLLPAMIADWRHRWEEGEFPFLFVQIAPFEGMPPEIREAQLQAWQETENTAMVVTVDVGDAKDIHPANKAPVGSRLAIAARALAYGEDVEYSGPVYSSMKIKGSRAVLSFTHLGGGLVAKDGPLYGFSIAGEDGVFYPAEAKLKGKKVQVFSPEVRAPEAVRYAWANVATGNLFNKVGLPASPFRTDAE